MTFCCHLDCTQRAAYRFTWTGSIARQERTCDTHARVVQAALIPSIKIERIGSKR